MITISKEEEFEKIYSLIQCKKDLHEVEFLMLCSKTDHPDYLPLMRRKQEIKSIIDKIVDELQRIEKPRASLEILDCLKTTFHEMKSSINTDKHNFPVSKRQLTILENYFISIIDDEVKRVINGKLRGLISPFLTFTKDKEDSIDRNLIIDFINNEIQIINSIKSVNYIVLLDYYDGFRQRLRQLIS